MSQICKSVPAPLARLMSPAIVATKIPMKRPRPLAFLVSFVFLQSAGANTAAGTETLVGIVGKDFVLLGADSSVSSSIALTARNLDKIAVLIDPFPSIEEVPDSSSQQVICAAAAGDSADCDRLLNLLRAELSLAEFTAGVGCDVEMVDCSGGDESRSLSTSPPGMDVGALAELARAMVVENMRRSPFRACLLVAGMSKIRQDDSSGISHIASRLQHQVVKASSPFLTTPLQPDTQGLMPREETELPSGLVPRLYWLDEYGAAQKVEYGAHGYGSALILSVLDQGFRRDMTKGEATELMNRCFEQLRARFVINSPNPPCIKCIDASGCKLVR